MSSGLNTSRSGLTRLYRAIERKHIDRVIGTYPDRLTRFGLSYLRHYFASHGATIEVMEQPSIQSMEEEQVKIRWLSLQAFQDECMG